MSHAWISSLHGSARTVVRTGTPTMVKLITIRLPAHCPFEGGATSVSFFLYYIARFLLSLTAKTARPILTICVERRVLMQGCAFLGGRLQHLQCFLGEFFYETPFLGAINRVFSWNVEANNSEMVRPIWFQRIAPYGADSRRNFGAYGKNKMPHNCF
jgi:hypothetical protein